MEAINTKAIKTKVAEDNNYACWDDILYGHQNRNVSNTELKRLENEVISEVAKQVAEDQKMICSEEAKSGIVKFKMLNGVKNATYSVINKESILNAPIPEIK